MNDLCERTQEAWLAASPLGDSELPGELGDHLRQCGDCGRFLDKAQHDQDALRAAFGAVVVPPAPQLKFREPLHAASGHPRRVSLSILPLLLALLLVLILVIFALVWIVRDVQSARGENVSSSRPAEVLLAVESELEPRDGRAPKPGARVP